MEITSNFPHFKAYFATYQNRFDQINELLEYQIPKSLRLFDIRFRLGLSLQVGFDSDISYTKTETTRKAYKLIYKLNDLWFAYEGLYKLCAEVSFLKSNPTKSRPFTGEKIQELDLADPIDHFNQYLNENLLNQSRSKEDFADYLLYLKENSKGRVQSELLNSFSVDLERNAPTNFSEIIAFIYAIRNMHVHNTDTAKSGVKYYKTKIEALKNCHDFLVLSILQIGTKVLDVKLEEIK